MRSLQARREFLRFLAASPLAARAWGQNSTLPPITMSSPNDALNLIDFEDAARRILPPAHWGYLTTGVDDDATLKANREGYKHWQIRPRRLVDVSNVDTKVDLFGTTWDSPIFLCPVGSQKAFYSEGELATARAAKAKKTLQILSTVTSHPVEDVAKSLGRPPWFQLYLPATWNSTEKLVKRAEDAGCPALLLTVDLFGGRNTETLERFRRSDTRTCTTCHEATPTGNSSGASNRPMLKGLDNALINPRTANWEVVSKLRKLTKMKFFLKGIETREDALLALEHGADGVLVSNHGGRATEDGMATVESLPEVVDAVGRSMVVMLDGGVRRGTDVFKALALGARAVGIGRPYIYGLASFGQPGVEKVIDLLRAELELTMRHCGTTSIRGITSSYIKRV